MRTLLLAMILLAPPVLAIVPAPTAWVISSDLTLEDVPFVLAQDVLVMQGATLRLKNVSALVARPLNITVQGGLELVEGTRLAAAALPFDLWIEPGARLHISTSDLVGARLSLASNDARLENATLTNGALRVVTGSPTARDVRFQGSTDDLIVVLGGNLDIDRATLDGAGGAAVFITNAGTLRLANATVSQTGDYGIRSEGGAARIENTTFSLSPSYAVYANGGAIDIADSTFSTHCGAFIVNGATGSIARNLFTTLDHGLTLLQITSVSVTHNVFRGTQEAILSYASSSNVSKNKFENNENAVHIAPGSTISPLLRDNAFLGNNVAVDNDLSGAFDARWNWWGTVSGPGAGQFSGSVSSSPWLLVSPL